MNTMALVGMSDQPMMKKKLYQKREKAAVVSVSCSVRGMGLNEWMISAFVLKFLRIALDVQFVTIGSTWYYLLLYNTMNE